MRRMDCVWGFVRRAAGGVNDELCLWRVWWKGAIMLEDICGDSRISTNEDLEVTEYQYLGIPRLAGARIWGSNCSIALMLGAEMQVFKDSEVHRAFVTSGSWQNACSTIKRNQKTKIKFNSTAMCSKANISRRHSDHSTRSVGFINSDK